MFHHILPDVPELAFFCEALPEDGVYRVAIAVEGFGSCIPTSLIALNAGDALRICDRLNRRLGYRDRSAWSAVVGRLQYAGESQSYTIH